MGFDKTELKASQPLARALWVICLTSLACLAMMVSASPALSGTAPYRPLLFSFNGADTSGGAFSKGLNDVAVDNSTGAVYVFDPGRFDDPSPPAVCRFGANGVAQDFPASGDSCLYETPDGPFRGSSIEAIPGTRSEIAVDNSGVNGSRLHLFTAADNGLGSVHAFDPDGNFLWTLPPTPFEALKHHITCHLALGPDGSPWVSANGAKKAGTTQIRKFAVTGSPPTEVSSVLFSRPGFGFFCPPFQLDARGSIYVANEVTGLEKYEGDKKTSIDPRDAVDIAVDQSQATGHLFSAQSSEFVEFDSDGSEVGSFGGGELGQVQGIDYSSSLDRVYVADRISRTIKVYGPAQQVVVPDVEIEPVTDFDGATATFKGTVNPAGIDSSWHFEWKTIQQPWGAAQTSPSQDLPLDNDNHTVSFSATGLSPGVIYNVRLIGTNKELGVKAVSAVQSFSDIPASVGVPWVAPRSDTTAQFNARLNPNGNPTVYHFEYSSDGTSWTALPSHVTASPTSLVVADSLTGLDPNTSYSFRFFAENSLGPVSPQGQEKDFSTRPTPSEPTCSNEAVRAKQRSTYLPDCRAFELVNNPDKGNQNAGLLQAAPSIDGRTAVWNVAGGAPGSETGAESWFIAERTGATPSGWRSKALVPPASEQIGGGFRQYQPTVPNSGTSNYSRFVFKARSQQGSSTLVRLDRDQNQELLKDYPGGLGSPEGVDMTGDGTHVVLVDPATDQLEDVGVPGAAEVLSIMPNGAQSTCGLNNDYLSLDGSHKIATTDASRIYFEAKPNGSCGASVLGLYVRNREAGKTTLIDPGGDGNSPEFIRTSPDGRIAYFATHSNRGTLAALDPEKIDNNESLDVYRWDEKTGKSTCVTCQTHPDAGLAEGVLVSEDFSRLYFKSSKALAPGAIEGADNVYVQSGGELRFVAGGVPIASGQLSADGNVLLFEASANPNLTADVFAATCPSQSGGGVICRGLYVYDDRDQSLECISCARGGITSSSPGVSVVSRDGSTIAFETAQALTSRDVNGEGDIYRWRQGASRLVTDGITDFPDAGIVAGGSASLTSVGADGNDIFFGIAQPGLTGFERDGLANTYVAKVGGGFPPPTDPSRCVEDSCQGPLQAAPQFDAPGSAKAKGHGNQQKSTARLCPVRRGGKAKRGQRRLKQCQRKGSKGKHRGSKRQGKRRNR